MARKYQNPFEPDEDLLRGILHGLQITVFVLAILLLLIVAY